MFYRYNAAEDITALVNGSGRLIVYSEPNGGSVMFRCNSDGSFIGVETVSQALADSWGVLELLNIEGSLDAAFTIVVNGESVTYNGIFTPQVERWDIAPVGIFQVFKDESCREYFDGSTNVCYVRVNRVLDEEAVWGANASDNERFVFGPPTTEAPYYYLAVYVDYTKDFTGVLSVGTVIPVTARPGVTVNSPVTIFE